MSDGLNRVILIGRLGQDPELRQTNGGPVMNLSLACEESWFDKASGQRKSRTTWVPVVLWGARAEGLAKVLGKGDGICVEGSLFVEEWQDRQSGAKRSAMKVRASNVVLTGGRRGGGQRQEPEQDTSGYPGNDDDIPY